MIRVVPMGNRDGDDSGGTAPENSDEHKIRESDRRPKQPADQGDVCPSEEVLLPEQSP
jgi:hypothetical protein